MKQREKSIFFCVRLVSCEALFKVIKEKNVEKNHIVTEKKLHIEPQARFDNVHKHIFFAYISFLFLSGSHVVRQSAYIASISSFFASFIFNAAN